MLKYIAIDLETTGLDPALHNILEIGAVLETNGITPVEQLPRFRAILGPPPGGYRGDPVALSMNAGLLAEIGAGASAVCYKNPAAGLDAFRYFLEQNFGGVRPVAAGKNFGSFDRQFLNYVGINAFAHRSLDVGSMYLLDSDDKIPGLETCCSRAGIQYDASKAHTALYDAELVIKLVRAHFTWRRSNATITT